jgi:hypothetical protein
MHRFILANFLSENLEIAIDVVARRLRLAFLNTYAAHEVLCYF